MNACDIIEADHAFASNEIIYKFNIQSLRLNELVRFQAYHLFSMIRKRSGVAGYIDVSKRCFFYPEPFTLRHLGNNERQLSFHASRCFFSLLLLMFQFAASCHVYAEARQRFTYDIPFPCKFFALEISGKVFRTYTDGRQTLLSVGDEIFPEEGISTGANGQIILSSPGRNEIRLKENTRINQAGPFQWKVETGTAGFKIGNSGGFPFRIFSEHMISRLASGILVMKVNRIITRATILKGSAIVGGKDKTTRNLESRREIAGAAEELSEVYPATDDLYFAWYWNK